MDNPKHSAKLSRQLTLIDTLLNDAERTNSPNFTKWHRDTIVAIRHIFGNKTDHILEFSQITYIPSLHGAGSTDDYFKQRYQKGLKTASAVLKSMVEELEEYGATNPEQQNSDPATVVVHLCERFHAVVKQLRDRHEDRPTIEVEDEYDVQDLLHGLLKVHFTDIRTEEWTPSYAGSSARMDFLIKKESLVIEVKRTRKGMGPREVGEQLIIDIQKYKAHADCKCLICFVYDPEGRIGNPAGIETDLSKSYEGMNVIVIVAPKER